MTQEDFNMNESNNRDVQSQPEEATLNTPDAPEQQASVSTDEDLTPPESSSPAEQFNFYMQRANESHQGGNQSAAQAAIKQAGKLLEDNSGNFDLTHFMDFDELLEKITQEDKQQEEQSLAPESRRSRRNSLAGVLDRASRIIQEQKSRLQGNGPKRILEIGEQKLKLVHGQATNAYDDAAGKFDRGIKGLLNNIEIAKLYIQIVKHERNSGRLETMKARASARIDELEKQYSERQQLIKDSYRKELETTQSYFEEAENLRNLAETATLPGYSETLLRMAEHLEGMGNRAVEVAANQELKDLKTETIDIWRELKANLDFYTEQAEQLEGQIDGLRNEAQTHLNNATNLRSFVQKIREATGRRETSDAIPDEGSVDAEVISEPDAVTPEETTDQEAATAEATTEEATNEIIDDAAVASAANEGEEQPQSRSRRLHELRKRFFPIKN